VREIYNNSIKDKLLWRDFYLMAYRFTPRAKLYNKHIDERYDSIKWKNNKSDWNKLIHSQTGFLLIDAIMKEMTITGFTNNRNRMLLGMFWTKYLIINPFNLKYGSQSNFSRLLVDAIGPSQNKMNHNWITDFDYAGKQFSKKNTLSGRPMDISNKIIKKYDPDCLYIKQWLPHLQYIDNKELIHWNYEIANINNNIHPSPMFDPKEKYLEWIQASTL
jgi:deoxyribodipyrimidine photo-lyase